MAQDWPRFLGSDQSAARMPQPLGFKPDDSDVVSWKLALPGPGSSSPIVVGGRVFVTCYSGYGVNGGSDDIKTLVRHLFCIDRSQGEIVWSRELPAIQPEDGYTGYITDHGYASNSPVSDGESVFVHFGKTGVLAFDLEGNQKWQASVGTSASKPRWGSAASLTIVGDLLVVNAAEESHSIRALNKQTGKEIWSTKSEQLELCYGTPRAVTGANGQPELIISALGEVWGLDANTGELNWLAKTPLTDNINPSPVVGDGVVYCFGGFRSSGSVAVRLGGTDDVTDSHMQWAARSSSYVATPLLYEGHLYWIDYHGMAFCISADSGEEVYKKRVPGFDRRRPVYASPVLAGDKIYVVTRNQGLFVIAAEPTFNISAIIKFPGDKSDFNATPAMSDGQMFVRSNEHLYCLGKAK